jgi:tRNA1(Val) A37 N6-methylase TrmN6
MTTIETTFDAFLGGRITLEQPTKGYRAGVDPVLLAASVPACAGQSVLELGCGTGAALLCLASRVEDLDLSGIEMQPHYADLCRANVDANRFGATIYTADLRALPADLTALSFDQILANPPYFQRNAGYSSPHEDRDIAFGGATKTQDWLDVAYRRLKPKGWLTLIQKADRLPEILRALDARFGSITVTPIVGRHGRNADRFILRVRKHGMTPFALNAPVVLHQGDTHLRDGEDYHPNIKAVLRDGAQFPFPD